MDISLVQAATKLSHEQHHFLGLWSDLGYTGWAHNATDAKILSGVAPSVGIGYRLFYNGFIMQTGIEAQYKRMTYRIPDYNDEELMQDADIGKEQFTMYITLSERKDIYNMVNVNIPLYFGYEKQRFYFLVGAAAQLNVYGYAKTQAVLTTKAQYEQLIGVYEGFGKHGISTQSVPGKDTLLSTNYNALLHAEIGARVDKYNPKSGFYKHRHFYRMYVSAFVDYGIPKEHKNAMGDQIEFSYDRGVEATIVPLMFSNQMEGKKVHSFTVGIKFTAMFELPQHGKSYIYDYNKVDRNYRKRGGNQTIK